LDQDESEGRTGLEFIRDLGCFNVDSDPIVLRCPGDDLDRDFSDPFGCKPLGMIPVLFDPNSQESVTLPDMGHSFL